MSSNYKAGIAGVEMTGMDVVALAEARVAVAGATALPMDEVRLTVRKDSYADKEWTEVWIETALGQEYKIRVQTQRSWDEYRTSGFVMTWTAEFANGDGFVAGPAFFQHDERQDWKVGLVDAIITVDKVTMGETAWDWCDGLDGQRGHSVFPTVPVAEYWETGSSRPKFICQDCDRE